MVSFFLLDTSWSPQTGETLPPAVIKVPLQQTTDTKQVTRSLMFISGCIFGIVAAFLVHVAEFLVSFGEFLVSFW